jgi:hypothetical protein
MPLKDSVSIISSTGVVAGRPSGVHHELALHALRESELFHDAGEDQISLVDEGVQARNQQDGVDLPRREIGVGQCEVGGGDEVAHEVALRVSPGGQLSDSDEDGVIHRSLLVSDGPA